MSSSNGPNFTMSYDELVNLSYEKQAYLTRDVADLTSRGITVARIAGIATLRTAFFNIPTDGVMVGLINVAITNRDAAVAPLIAIMQEIFGIARNTFGEKSGEYKTFGSTELNRLDPSALVRLCSNIVLRANNYLSQMAPHGLDAAMVTDLETKANAVQPLIVAVDEAEGNRPLATVQRHKAANALFDELKSMCNTAQVYYADRNPTKAANYIIYDTAGTVQQRNGDVATNSTVTRELKGIAANSTFSLKVNEGASLVFYFSKTEGGVAGTKSITVANNPNNFTTTTAEALGYNNLTGFIYFCIHNPSVDEVGNYSVKVA
jgi:hypothetical protein